MYNIRKNQSRENLVTDGGTNGQMDRGTDRQADKSDFIGCCSTKIDPTNKDKKEKHDVLKKGLTIPI